MDDNKLIIFALKTCPYCFELKKELEKNNISFFEMDINEYQPYWIKVMKYCKNDFVPTILIMNKDKIDIYMSMIDFQNLDEIISIIKKEI